MKTYFDMDDIKYMQQVIINRYGPTIHGDLVKEMSADRLARIYVAIKKLEERMVVRKNCIDGQMSLFD